MRLVPPGALGAPAATLRDVLRGEAPHRSDSGWANAAARRVELHRHLVEGSLVGVCWRRDGGLPFCSWGEDRKVEVCGRWGINWSWCGGHGRVSGRNRRRWLLAAVFAKIGESRTRGRFCSRTGQQKSRESESGMGRKIGQKVHLHPLFGRGSRSPLRSARWKSEGGSGVGLGRLRRTETRGTHTNVDPDRGANSDGSRPDREPHNSTACRLLVRIQSEEHAVSIWPTRGQDTAVHGGGFPT